MDFRGSKSVFSKKQRFFFGGLGRSKKGAFFCAPNRICQNVAIAGHRPDPQKNKKEWHKFKKRGNFNFRHSLLFFLDRTGCGCNDVGENAVKNKVLATSRGRISAKMDMFSKTVCFFSVAWKVKKNTLFWPPDRISKNGEKAIKGVVVFGAP